MCKLMLFGEVSVCNYLLGIYEKVLVKDFFWLEWLVLVKSCGFDFVEMLVDEIDEWFLCFDWSIV